jgi:glycosyltransferase involved in cell wall biosynthesis
MPQLSVIIPVYNEAKTIRQILEKINSLDIDKEIILVDDGSTDEIQDILKEIINLNNLKIICHATNRGKGAAFLTGLSYATGDFVIIQDADLEYDPGDYLKLLNVIKEEKAEIVLGIRFSEGYQGLFIHRLGNHFLTKLMNILFNSRINDYATCYKLASKETWNDLNLKASGFDIDVEIICNALKRKKRIAEIPISYYPRTYKEGKKIRWKDGLWAIFYMFKYWFIK